MPRFDEASLRREHFRPDVAVVLADGQEWFIPKPWVRIHPAIGPDGLPTLTTRTSLGHEFDKAIDQARAAEESGENYASVLAMFAVARSMLKTNYDMDPTIEAEILAYAPDDPELELMWARILEVATGQAPKLSTAGNDSP